MQETNVIRHRRYLHQIPEIGFDLPKTKAYIETQLNHLGYEVFTVAESGLIAFKEGSVKQAIAFRADMDALEIQEQNEVVYKSRHHGRMHACGHDAHMAMLLGFAEMMAKKTHLKKSIVLVFEPAEETLGGAKDIMASGMLSKYDIEAIFALHLDPDLEEGKLGITDGIMTAQDGDFDLTISGANAHGTNPHQGNDALLAASQLAQQYHTIISRSLDPMQAAVINIGTMHVGEGRNIIANKAEIKGSIRAFNFGVFQHLKNRMRQIDAGIEHAYNVTIDNKITDLHPPVINDHDLYKRMKETFSKHAIEDIKPMLLAEDFSYYQQQMPGLFVMLGTKNLPLGYNQPLHSSEFNFNEAILSRGVDTLIKLAEMMNI